MADDKLLRGLSRFQKDVYPEQKDLFEKLGQHQRPDRHLPGDRQHSPAVPGRDRHRLGDYRVACGVMRGALNPGALEGFPNVTAWLRDTNTVVRDPAPCEAFLLALTEGNVVARLRNLRFHPSVAARLEKGDLQLQGWVYHIGPGLVTVYDEASQKFANAVPA